MKFEVLQGVPHVEKVWRDLMDGLAKNSLTRPERGFAKKLAKAVDHLGKNPFHPGLQSHEITDLSDRYGMKVFESYLENDTPVAGRIFWVYGPDRAQITVVAIEPHPEDKRGAYNRVQLSALPPTRDVHSQQPATSQRSERRKR
jgi:hypothetical protein